MVSFCLGKKMSLRPLLLLSLSAIACMPSYAQDKVDAEIGTDLVSTYVWRGQKCGGVSVQPGASLSWKGLSLGTWGSFAISPTSNGSDEEIDVTLSYETKGFHVGITDYYLFNNGYPFFKYGGLGSSNHTFEANVGYDFGFLSVNWFTNFAGEDGVNSDGKRAYSSYLQLDAPFKLAKLDWTATLGVVPYNTSFYGSDVSSGFHINQIALKAEYPFELKHVTVPLYAQVVANPSSQALYFMVGCGISINK